MWPCVCSWKHDRQGKAVQRQLGAKDRKDSASVRERRSSASPPWWSPSRWWPAAPGEASPSRGPPGVWCGRDGWTPPACARGPSPRALHRARFSSYLVPGALDGRNLAVRLGLANSGVKATLTLALCLERISDCNEGQFEGVSVNPLALYMWLILYNANILFLFFR